MFRTLTDNLPTILRKNIIHEISPKSFSQGFLLILKFSKNFPKTHREFSEKIAHEFYWKPFMSFMTSQSFPRIWDNFVKHVLSILLGGWIPRAGWHYPAQWSANQIVRKQGRMSSH